MPYMVIVLSSYHCMTTDHLDYLAGVEIIDRVMKIMINKQREKRERESHHTTNHHMHTEHAH